MKGEELTALDTIEPINEWQRCDNVKPDPRKVKLRG